MTNEIHLMAVSNVLNSESSDYFFRSEIQKMNVLLIAATF
jgi:hypothetical protein